MARIPYLFVSYSSREAGFALKLAIDLRKAGFEMWMDRLGGIPVGDNWQEQLTQALNGCAGLVAIVSPAYFGSRNCLDELHFAHRNDRFIFPVRLQDFSTVRNIPYFFLGIQYVDFIEWRDERRYRKNLAVLIEAIGKKVSTRPHNKEDEIRLSKNSFIAFLDGIMADIRRARLGGKSPDAIKMADYWYTRFDEELRSGKHPPDLVIDLLKRQVLVVYEKSIAQREIFLADVVVDGTQKTSTDLFYCAEELAKEYGDEMGFGLLYSHEGDAFYIAEDYDRALDKLNQSISYLTGIFELQALRPLALVNANLKNEVELEVIIGKIIGNIRDNRYEGEKLEEVCQALEGIARSYFKLKSPKGFPYLQQGLALWPLIGDVPIRLFQLDRTQLEGEPVLEPEQRASLTPVGDDVLVWSQSYPRWERQLKKLLKK